MRAAPNGVLVPLVTPLRLDGTVDDDAVGRLVAAVAPHVSGLVPALSTGEGWLLDDLAWRAMLDATLRHRAGLPVLVGVQSADEDVVLDRVRAATRRGVNAVVLGPPLNPGCDADDVVAHYAAVRKASPVPLFLYNEQALGGQLMDLATIGRILRLQGIVGIKDSSGDPAVTAAIAEAFPQLPVFQGWENQITAVDTAGFVGPLANLEPALCAAALADPSLQAEVDAAAHRFGIFDDEWFAPVKRELTARGVLSCSATVAELTAAIAEASTATTAAEGATT